MSQTSSGRNRKGSGFARVCLLSVLKQETLDMRLFKRVGVAAGLLLASALAFGAATSNYWQNKTFDGVWRAQTALAVATTYTSLHTATASAQSCPSEVSGGSYSRVAVTSSLANWSGTQGAGTTTASSNASGSSGTISNNNAISFPAPTANWGRS